MLNPSFHLYQLQKVDLKLDALNKRLAEIDRIRKDNSVRMDLENTYKVAKNQLDRQQKEYSDLVEKIDAKKLKSEQSESSLYSGSIKNPKELQDLQNEIKSLKNSISLLEDSQLQQMIDLEQSQGIVLSAQTAIDSFEEKNKLNFSILFSEELEKKTEIDKIDQERKLIMEQIDPINLEKYSQLRSSKKGIALSTIEDGCCAVCGTTLTPADCQTAKSPSKMAFCSSCGRILYAG